jgi:hypothetical protein
MGPSSSHYSRCWLWAALLVSITFRTRPIWMDEAYSYFVSTQPLQDILFNKIDNHPPLFYVLQHFWNEVDPGVAAIHPPAAMTNCRARMRWRRSANRCANATRLTFASSPLSGVWSASGHRAIPIILNLRNRGRSEEKSATNSRCRCVEITTLSCTGEVTKKPGGPAFGKDRARLHDEPDGTHDTAIK